MIKTDMFKKLIPPHHIIPKSFIENLVSLKLSNFHTPSNVILVASVAENSQLLSLA